jgi:hypothetical protein
MKHFHYFVCQVDDSTFGRAGISSSGTKSLTKVLGTSLRIRNLPISPFYPT